MEMKGKVVTQAEYSLGPMVTAQVSLLLYGAIW